MASAAQDLLLDQAADLVTVHGEPVALAGREVLGIFTPRGRPTEGIGSEVGLLGRLSAQPNPVVLLLTDDAAELVEGDSLTIRAAEYTVTRLDADGDGLTRVELMPAAATDPDRLDRWR